MTILFGGAGMASSLGFRTGEIKVGTLPQVYDIVYPYKLQMKLHENIDNYNEIC